MNKPRFMAIVEFCHANGCSIGQPYGECVVDCGYKVVRLVSRTPLTDAELATHGVAPAKTLF